MTQPSAEFERAVAVMRQHDHARMVTVPYDARALAKQHVAQALLQETDDLLEAMVSDDEMEWTGPAICWVVPHYR